MSPLIVGNTLGTIGDGIVQVPIPNGGIDPVTFATAPGTGVGEPLTETPFKNH